MAASTAVDVPATDAGMIRQYTFQDKIQDVKICGLILAMKDSFIIWVGTGAGCFTCLDVAMKTPMDAMPIACPLLGSSADAPGNAIAKRLSMKLKAQVFLSYSLPAAMTELQLAVEARLAQELKKISQPGSSQASGS
mmetsp:Transcript_32795/g.65816  ORF Transcript_32795/g.65816 Transcript_32795/m.65816 type:complete len:137 (-) Transcript_32795:47-457(-)